MENSRKWYNEFEGIIVQLNGSATGDTAIAVWALERLLTRIFVCCLR